MANNISCDAHDYFEIVCMRQSHVIVISKKHETYTGIAAGIKLINKQEYLK
jgi:Rho-binding antiterminator